jgi:hypothetical protein
MDKSSLDKLKDKREVWMHCLSDKNDGNSIFHQIHNMVWDMGVFKIINESLRVAPPAKEGGVQLNGVIWHLIDHCFFESQMLAIRRLVDNLGLNALKEATKQKSKERTVKEFGLTGKGGVYSLKILIFDIKENIDFLTRENLFKLNGLEYDVELIERKKNEYIIREQKRLGEKTPIAIPRNLRPNYSKLFHERIDKLCGIKPEDRKPNDKVQVKIFDDLMKNLEKAVEKEESYVNKYLAHAATKESRESAKINIETNPPTLQSILEAQETIAKTANYIGNIFELNGLVFSGLPSTPSFDILEYIENPFATVDKKPKLEKVWFDFKRQTEEWHKWEEII